MNAEKSFLTGNLNPQCGIIRTLYKVSWMTHWNCRHHIHRLLHTLYLERLMDEEKTIRILFLTYKIMMIY